ncbi:ribosomal protein L7/L12 [Streptomyces rimosus]|uniref:ribosomal protein L7/L12 n=1 Tax=Streptomyces rimosus TaxID=1927 RepID=UPI0004CAC300|nr:ribosomal protein L7/L12 [Streptomyces rimosus]
MNSELWTAIAAAVVVIVVLASTMDARHKTLERRLRRMDRKLDLIMEHLGIEETGPEGMAEIDALLHKGKKIEAIKRYRELTGAGLVEAKEAVERRER